MRARLGIPADAERVMVFAETSHWDPNWLLTAEEYFTRRVRHTLDAVLRELEAEPRRVFSIECVFFLRMYWERYPEKRDRLRALMAAGRIRLTGTGITTPDTTLPHTEAIVRDYLLGREWLREQRLAHDPAVAYLPDNFGNSPALPSLLAAMGYRYAAVSRIDGMRFVGDDWRGADFYPRPGSSAHHLEGLRALDFRWRGPHGAEVVCHWNAFTYFQGDMLAYRGVIRWMGRVLGWADRSPRHVARRIAKYARQLEPLSPTPYLLCPIGCDFNDPIPGLVALLDRYNEQEYPRTGLWVLNAALEDHLDLVATRPLPVVELDPNPYWMGFYATRPQLKQRCRRITEQLVTAEALVALAPAAAAAREHVKGGWDRLVVSNHHDFITGTTPERVFRVEQARWLEAAETCAEAALGAALAAVTAPVDAPAKPPEWSLRGGVLTIDAPQWRLRLEEKAGGCITSWRCARSGREHLRGPSNDLVLHADSGGLWRMGHEFRGGTFRVLERASARSAAIRVEEADGALIVTVLSTLGGLEVERTLWLRSDTPALRMRVRGRARRRRTITCHFAPALVPDGVVMDVPGGVVRRALAKVYSPTYWCASSFAHVRDRHGGHGIAALFGGAGSVSVHAEDGIGWVALRNTPKERAFGFLPILAHPAAGPNDGEHGIEYAVHPTGGGDWRHNGLAAAARSALSDFGLAPLQALVDGFVQPRGATLEAIKPAEDGRGVVVRLSRHSAGDAPIVVRLGQSRRAILCDALERDLAELGVSGGACEVPGAASLVTLRLLD